MDSKKAVNKLKEDIQDIYSIVNRFENSNKIHQLDIDLALSKVRNLYELFLKINPQDNYSTDTQQKEISTIIEKEIKEEKVIKPVEEKPVEKIPVVEEKKEKIEVKEVIETPIEETKEEIVDEEINTDPEFIIETPKTKEVVEESEFITENKEIVADKFQSKKFVHDNIAKNGTKKDVSTKMQTKPIKDINTAIGLNDKFIFIRELFGGDKNQYIETIQVLNNFDTFENAIEFLNENFDWDSEDENFIRLTELVKRKYSK